MAPTTVVQFYKYPKTPHWRFEMRYLGSDDHGTWLGAPAHTTGQRGAEPPVLFRDPFVVLVPPAGWWMMVLNAAPRDPEIYIDVCTPASWQGKELVESVDLDLDVIRKRNGTVILIDEDEFEVHRRELGYSEAMVSSTRITAAELMLAVERRRPPFDDTGLHWLDMVEHS